MTNLEPSGLHLHEKFPARLVNARIKNATIDGGVGIDSDGHGVTLPCSAYGGNMLHGRNSDRSLYFPPGGREELACA